MKSNFSNAYFLNPDTTASSQALLKSIPTACKGMYNRIKQEKERKKSKLTRAPLSGCWR